MNFNLLFRVILVSSAVASAAAAIQLATTTAVYTWYSNYALHSAYNVTAYTLTTATQQICAYQCTITANCFAATLIISSKQCLVLSGGCGVLSLQTNNNAVTCVKAGLPLSAQKPLLNYPFISNCGSWAVQVGYGSLSAPIINNATNVASFATGWAAASNVLSFTTQNSFSPFYGTTFVTMNDVSGNVLPQYTVNSGYTISFMYRPTLAIYDQGIIGFLSATNDTCFNIFQGTCGSSCLAFSYSATCSSSWTFGATYITAMNVWHHVAAVYDPIARTYTVYVNGTAVSYSSFTQTNATFKVTNVYIGNYVGPKSYINFVGQFYCLQIYNATISASDVNTLSSICRTGGVFLN